MARVWLIGGPTASGKSALALRLAEALGAEVVNADSMQLYADLQVLTARPTASDLTRAPHHLYGVADAAEAWSAGRWLRAVRATLASIGARDRDAVVVGGTGLYFRALTQGLADIPPVPTTVRKAVQAEFDALGEGEFRARLRRGDPEAEGRISMGDRQRLVRALEVLQATGRPISAWQAGSPLPLAAGDRQAVWLDPPRADLYARCDARVEEMVDRGVLAEVEALAARGLDPALPSMKTLGLQPFARHLDGALELEAAVRLAQQETRRYAKRQVTWFRHQTPDWRRLVGSDLEMNWAQLGAATASQA